ncbi:MULTISPECIES: ACT domain-containing protein [unclassified Gilliamella]|uniref:ACT domain-containing protein n=1 Tax=unclassified Gilliamella TaxID=2685620 RepID=UPI00080DDFBC|nr:MULTISPECIES: ACT domain-containing protein [Gilliamella]MCX8575513.1 ACT domain-containing protein [Gilliamella sp. B3831]MCX8577760.1 ACT domain-containing protein [Gilliamella sp. B3815]MCX8579179.1 ACT domain-containing protein [Gilliamella sp. B2717]MCX8588599.1 ACT domain-containing protein [Gilliamella sp. B3801]MCX8590136.1 ACT domain-containing protein [Gilliamella sp. B3812]
MKTILTVIGKDQTGIIAGISQKLYELNINILDVSQTIMGEYFTMIMLLDLSKIDVSFDDVKNTLTQTGENLKVKVNIQREEIFDAMHRL